jgi:murein hydrolase activator
LKPSTILVIAIFLLAPAVSAQSDKKKISDQQKELRKIQTEMEQGQRRLDSLRAEELRVQRQASESDERLAGSKKVVSRLSGQLSGLRKSVEATSAKLDSTREEFDRAQRRFLGNARQMYFASRSRRNLESDNPVADVELNRQITYLAKVVNFEYGAVAQTSAVLGGAVQRLDSLSVQNKQIKRLKEKREVAIALERSRKIKQEKQLDKLRRGQTETADRVIMLEQSLADMEGIIDRIERTRREEATRERAAREAESNPATPQVSAFAMMKGRLIAPMRGKVVESYGNKIDPVRKLKSFSPGIAVQGNGKTTVVAVGSGKVVYAGSLRGYGNFVIIDHGESYYSTTAGLETVVVKENQRIAPDQSLGLSSADGKIKFELRHGRDLLDPVEWIALDAF